MEKWNHYSEKFLQISPRERYLIILTGLISIIFILFNFVIANNIAQIAQHQKTIAKITSSNQAQNSTIKLYEEALLRDPNKKSTQQIAKFETQLSSIDAKLFALTSELIDPVQMRYALLDLLKVQKGVSLISFQLIGPHPIAMVNEKAKENDEVSKEETEVKTTENLSPTLYRHGIKLKLAGSYFKLRDYLTQLEGLEWKFFWQNFDYKLLTYPDSELEIHMYSLSTKKEFVGV